MVKNMNQHSDSAVSWGSLMSVLSSMAGMVTLERVYMFTAIAGALIALFGYLDKRRTEKLERQSIEEERRNQQERMELDRERAQAVLDYLEGSKDTPSVQKSREVIQGINKVLDAAKE